MVAGINCFDCLKSLIASKTDTTDLQTHHRLSQISYMIDYRREKPRVAMVTSSVTRAAGGLAPIVLRLTASLVNSGYPATILSVEDEYWSDVSKKIGAAAGEAFPACGPAKVRSAVRYSPGLHRRLEQLCPEVAHTHGLWQYPSMAVLKWGQSTKRPWVVSPQGMLDKWALDQSPVKKRVASIAFESKHLGQAGCVHALAEGEYEAIRAFGIRSPICLIPNGVDSPEFAIGQEPAWKNDCGDRRVLLFLGRIHPKKGLSELIEAWRMLNEQDPVTCKWFLAIVGWDDGNHLQALRQQAADAGLSDCIGFYGPVFDGGKSATLSSANAFVLPSYSEGMPMAVLEAWSHGLVAAITPKCNLSEGYEHGGAVKILPEPHSIASGLQSILRLKESEQAIRSQMARAFAEEQFSWKIIANKFRSVYDWLAGHDSRPNCVRLD
ncbi:MAG TPA: glycosyl transferase family 1 [Rhodopirellula baltica]|uniref:Uncharacterized protein n=1 Tax=Rhodopirellula baltica (strain DSM 10527 / NCIMB 13988 / SH1) TaxID=243090 RepID=Q7UVS3_RHOBA|nr:glycosyltransferase [Rhodopirellula baltica]CAD72648.1 conserved hypothetical protein-putative poly(glycerol-phosphate) alpha-glucosyltransferase [Rhodopirellula baltica SH 1]HBE65517.1 glycosyl transferase family 1 [Rhodopirellula baltica]